jgi:hypothetical protein
VKFGTEYWVAPLLALRLGYNSGGSELKTDYGSDILAGASAGVGFSLKKYFLDYSIQPMVDLGFTHAVTLSYLF